MAGVLLYCLSAKYHALFSSIFGFHFIYQLMLTEALKRRRRTFKLPRHAKITRKGLKRMYRVY